MNQKSDIGEHVIPAAPGWQLVEEGMEVGNHYLVTSPIFGWRVKPGFDEYLDFVEPITLDREQERNPKNARVFVAAPGGTLWRITGEKSALKLPDLQREAEKKDGER